MEKQFVQTIIDKCNMMGAEYSDLFFEKKLVRTMDVVDGKLDNIKTNILDGLGIRLASGDNKFYTYTNDLTLNNIIDIIENVGSKLNTKASLTTKLDDLSDNSKIQNNTSDLEKKNYLLSLDKIVRNYSKKISQVNINLYESDQDIYVVNSEGKFVKDKRYLTGIFVSIYASDGSLNSKLYETYRTTNNFEYLKSLNIEKKVLALAESTVKALYAKDCPGGEMPVIIGPGFGAVIFHEACGHAMEATTVAKGISVLSNKLNEKIASDKVTIIDDGTIPNAWGTCGIDDEGNNTEKNILIENGILKSYLVDKLNSKKMNHKITGSGRRQNYQYMPTSRMNNTYLESGTDSIEDMIKSINYGLYAKSMNGGTVNPITGDFNFGVSEAYLIKDGKIDVPIKGASLIGNTLDILKQVEMVGNDFKLGAGWCGSDSGSVPVCCGQPTIKVSKIIVGGTSNDR